MIVDLLQICHSAHPPFADIARCYERAAVLNGWSVRTVFLSGAVPDDVPGAVSLDLSSAQLAGLKLRAWRRLAAQVRGNYRLVIAHRYKPLYLAMLARPGPVVGVAHEFGLLERASRRWTLGLLGRSVRVAGVSTAVADELAARVGCQRTLVLPNVLDLDVLRPQLLDRPAARRALGFDPGVRLVGHVGRLHRKKNLPVLLEAFARLRKQPDVQDTELVLIGDGPERDRLTDQAAALGCAAQVHFPGKIPAARNLLAALDVLVVSSGAQEAFGMTVLEGVAAGVPVVTSNVGGPAQLFDGRLPQFVSGDAASLARVISKTLAAPPPASALVDLLERNYSVPALAARLSALVGAGAGPTA